MPPRGAPEESDQHVLVELRDLAHGRDPAPPELLRRHPADAPEPLDRKRMQEPELVARRHEEETVRLRNAARDLGEELRPRDPDRDRQPDLLQHLAAEPRRDLDRRPGQAPQAADVEERLVDRQPLDERRRVFEHPEHRLARLRVRRHPRGHDDRMWAQPSGLSAAHRGADAVRLRLVARRENDTGADDHRSATEPRVVTLLDGRVEGVEIGVKDLRLGRQEHMFPSTEICDKSLLGSRRDRPIRRNASCDLLGDAELLHEEPGAGRSVQRRYDV